MWCHPAPTISQRHSQLAAHNQKYSPSPPIQHEALDGGCRKAVVEDLHCCYACHSQASLANTAHVRGGEGVGSLRNIECSMYLSPLLTKKEKRHVSTEVLEVPCTFQRVKEKRQKTSDQNLLSLD